MNIKKFVPDYHATFKYLLLFVIYLIFNNLEKEVMPYSVAIFSVSVVGDFSIFASSIFLLLSFVVTGNFGFLPFSSIACVFFIIVLFIYKRFNHKPKTELILFTAIAMTVFCILGNTVVEIPLEKRIAVSIFNIVVSLLAYIFVKAVTEKGLKLKFGYEEFASGAVLSILFGIGICNFLSPFVWKTISVFLIIFTAFLYRKGVCTLFSAVIGASFSLYFNNISYASAYMLMGVGAESLIHFSRYFSALAIILIDYLAQALFGVYGAYQLIDFISAFIGVIGFCIIPISPLNALKDKLSLFREKQLVRISINRNRTILSNRLYELSTVFTEMSQAFSSFKQIGLNNEKAKSIICKDVLSNVCNNCSNAIRCKKYEQDIVLGLNKMVEIGFAKGKLSLIDVPKEFGGNCVHPNDVLFCINKLLSDYRQLSMENENVDVGRRLIADEVKGISNILQELALESGTTLKYHAKLEKKLTEKLMQNGFCVSELLIYGEEKQLSIGIVLTMKEFVLERIIKIIKSTIGLDMSLTEKFNVGDDKCYLSFVKTVPYDVIYGIAVAKKDNSEASGDTHSVTRITGDRFLVALSDGMGSGRQANNVSSVALSLIESFYRAGMKSDLILNTVARLMAITTEECFTALDISIIDLKDCTADFIKYGAPYGFILNDNGIRIVEGNSLPLGILDELKPSVCNAQLNENDTLVLITDGIADCFTSSGELIDFLKTQPALNPQTLANNVMEKALSLSRGNKNDDMTVLATRIYKKTG